jgi:hypothetical protein
VLGIELLYLMLLLVGKKEVGEAPCSGLNRHDDVPILSLKESNLHRFSCTINLCRNLFVNVNFRNKLSALTMMCSSGC